MPKPGKPTSSSPTPKKTTRGFWAFFFIIIVALDHLAKWEGLWQFFNSSPPAEWLQQKGIPMTPYTFILIVAAIILFIVFWKDKEASRSFRTNETSQFFWRPWIMVGSLAIIFLIAAFVKPFGVSRLPPQQSPAPPNQTKNQAYQPCDLSEDDQKTLFIGESAYNQGNKYLEVQKPEIAEARFKEAYLKIYPISRNHPKCVDTVAIHAANAAGGLGNVYEIEKKTNEMLLVWGADHDLQRTNHSKSADELFNKLKGQENAP